MGIELSGEQLQCEFVFARIYLFDVRKVQNCNYIGLFALRAPFPTRRKTMIFYG